MTPKTLTRNVLLFLLAATAALAEEPTSPSSAVKGDALAESFATPPPEARPWAYWMFMDGNLTREGMTADLEAMQHAGIGGVIFLEVNLGIPRGPIEFMSDSWRALLQHAVNEADRLGLEFALAAGPGWCGTGGPWVKPEQSMQHLVASETKLTGPAHFDAPLAQPQPRTPFFGEETLTPELKKVWKEFYRDVAVLAFPTPKGEYRIPDVNEKALYFRAPYSSQPGVKPFLTADSAVLSSEQCIAAKQIIELTGSASPDGRLVWDVPPGDWTVLRFGRTVTGQTTRPAPVPGLGLECDKFEKASLDAHFERFVETLLKTIGEPQHPGRGLTDVHFDSWEMSSQNWSEHFREEFQQRRGYDPMRFLPAMLGFAVENVEMSERFLWDLRRTAQELVVENHAMHLKELARRHGLTLSIEPYDLNPAGDLALGGAADIPMCEFWSKGYGFSAEFSVFEAVSIAHTQGRPITAAESFTSTGDAWRQHPGSMKAQGDWALCAGVNRIVFHRCQHQPWLDRFPGMTFGPHGVHWDRTETWWDMASAFHAYLARCQTMLRRGLPVADVLYLDAEGAPNVFCPPASAMLNGLLDRRGYNFDGCAPGTLIERASVQDGRIVFPDGMNYRLLVLPRFETMTPALLRKIKQLVDAGAVIVGEPPKKSPSLEKYPQCDAEVRQLADAIWQNPRVIRDASATTPSDVYPSYDTTAQILAKMDIPPDFESNGDVRYAHRQDGDVEIYFVGNRTAAPLSADCRFRVTGRQGRQPNGAAAPRREPAPVGRWNSCQKNQKSGVSGTGRQPELWNPLTGERRALPEFHEEDGRTVVPLRFAQGESFFVVFRAGQRPTGTNFSEPRLASEIAGPWEVSFDPKWGGPEKPVAFKRLDDWTARTEDGIRHYSGTAVYRKTFDLPEKTASDRRFLDLGAVNNLAQVKLNGRDLGIVWCPPWRIALPTGSLKPVGNQLEIKVANLWPNRLIKDAGLPEKERLTWTTWNPYKPTDPLLPSGLLGPVRLMTGE